MATTEESGTESSTLGPVGFVEDSLRRLAPNVPGSVRFRLLNSLEHFDRALALLDRDLEIASFRAITGEEEAATALIRAIQLRGYPRAKEFNSRDHQHKAAVIACVMAIATEVAPILSEFQLRFGFERMRVDLKIPLSNFNVVGGEHYAIQPVEPLDLISRTNESAEGKAFDRALEHFATQSNFNSIKNMVSAQANARNRLLYASDSSLPRSKATRDNIENRKKRAMILLVLSVMVLQARKHQGLVRQAMSAFLGVMSRLPPERSFD